MRPGPITTGTLRLADLIPAFLGALEELAPEEAGRIRDRYAPVLDVLGTGTLARPSESSLTDFALQLFGDLEEALAKAAPEGLVFERQGADFGFYPQEETMQFDVAVHYTFEAASRQEATDLADRIAAHIESAFPRLNGRPTKLKVKANHTEAVGEDQ